MELLSAFLLGLLLIALIAVEAIDVLMLVVALRSKRRAAMTERDRQRGQPDAF